MGKYVFKTTKSVEEYCDRIVNELIGLFNISYSEANGRLNEFWSHEKQMDDDDMIFHMLPYEWANTIYYGSDARWWKGTEGLTPQPYPEDDTNKR